VLGLIAGKGVVEAKGAAYDEAAVGDVVHLAGGPLFDLIVDDERADMESFLLRGGACGVGDDAVGDAFACADANRMGLRTACGAEGQREEESSRQDLTHWPDIQEPHRQGPDTHGVARVTKRAGARYSPRVGGRGTRARV
jgi:hypothetical protein